jgi:hypothetical protein
MQTPSNVRVYDKSQTLNTTSNCRFFQLHCKGEFVSVEDNLHKQEVVGDLRQAAKYLNLPTKSSKMQLDGNVMWTLGLRRHRNRLSEARSECSWRKPSLYRVEAEVMTV